MSSVLVSVKAGASILLNPDWVPGYLLRSFDENLEAYPVQVDFDDLDQYMAYHHVEYEARIEFWRSGANGIWRSGPRSSSMAKHRVCVRSASKAQIMTDYHTHRCPRYLSKAATRRRSLSVW